MTEKEAAEALLPSNDRRPLIRLASLYILTATIALVSLSSTSHVNGVQRAGIDIAREAVVLVTAILLSRTSTSAWRLSTPLARNQLVVGTALALAFFTLQAAAYRLQLGTLACMLPLAAAVAVEAEGARPKAYRVSALGGFAIIVASLAGVVDSVMGVALAVVSASLAGASCVRVKRELDREGGLTRSDLLVATSLVLLIVAGLTAAYHLVRTSVFGFHLALYGFTSLDLIATVIVGAAERILFLVLLDRVQTADEALTLSTTIATFTLFWARDTAFLPSFLVLAVASASLAHLYLHSDDERDPDVRLAPLLRPRWRAALFPILPLLAWSALQLSPPSFYPSTSRLLLTSRVYTVDVVISHYDEAPKDTGSFIRLVRHQPWAGDGSSSLNVIVYDKGGDEEVRREMYAVGADGVVALPNTGREGATYLEHIIRRYNDTALPPRQRTGPMLADYTLFLQGAGSWMEVVKPRLYRFDPSKRVGFLSLGTLWRLEDCQHDTGNGMDWPLMKDIFTLFRQTICPPEPRLGGWQAQFFVSRERIMANSYESYANMHALITADSSHWIHNTANLGFEWGGKHWDASSPALGHTLERSWPGIFRCDDPTIAERCPNGEGDATPENCACLD